MYIHPAPSPVTFAFLNEEIKVMITDSSLYFFFSSFHYLNACRNLPTPSRLFLRSYPASSNDCCKSDEMFNRTFNDFLRAPDIILSLCFGLSLMNRRNECWQK